MAQSPRKRVHFPNISTSKDLVCWVALPLHSIQLIQRARTNINVGNLLQNILSIHDGNNCGWNWALYTNDSWWWVRPRYNKMRSAELLRIFHHHNWWWERGCFQPLHCAASVAPHRSVKLGFNPFHVDCLSSRQCSTAAAPCFPFQPNIFASCWNNLLTFNYELGGRVGGNELTVCSEENILLGPWSSLGCIVVITERINHRCTPHYALLELTEWPQAGLQLLHIKIYFII